MLENPTFESLSSIEGWLQQHMHEALSEAAGNDNYF
jgi:hypothetical protein